MGRISDTPSLYIFKSKHTFFRLLIQTHEMIVGSFLVSTAIQRLIRYRQSAARAFLYGCLAVWHKRCPARAFPRPEGRFWVGAAKQQLQELRVFPAQSRVLPRALEPPSLSQLHPLSKCLLASAVVLFINYVCKI